MMLDGMEDARTEYEIEFDFMSKLLNLGDRTAEGGGAVDKKLASDVSSGDDDDFRRKSVSRAGNEVLGAHICACATMKLTLHMLVLNHCTWQVDLDLFNRKLYRRRRRSNGLAVNEAAWATDEAIASGTPGNASDTPRKSMLNAKGGGGASGWWTKRNRVAPTITEEDADERSPALPGTKTKPLLALARLSEERIAHRLLGSSSDESSDDGDCDDGVSCIASAAVTHMVMHVMSIISRSYGLEVF